MNLLVTEQPLYKNVQINKMRHNRYFADVLFIPKLKEVAYTGWTGIRITESTALTELLI